LSARGSRTVEFTATAVVSGRVRHVFDVLTDWPRQTDWVPATVVARVPGTPERAVGERFVATTTLGPFVLVDPMEVVARVVPDVTAGTAGRVGIVKTGDVFGGTVELVVRSLGPGRVGVEWTEHVVVHPPRLARLAALTGRLPGFAGKTAFEAVLRRAADDLRSPS
jgi:voltage-gated potassium channel Kch